MFKTFAFTLLAATTLYSTATWASKATVYGKPAGWLFDLIKAPTTQRSFDLLVNGNKVACAQVTFEKNIECTLHGTGATVPKSSSEAEKSLCSIKADSVEAIFPGGDGGDVGVEGDTAKSIFSLMPTVEPTFHDLQEKISITRSYYGKPGIDGIMCTEALPDDSSIPSTYRCSISWE